MGSKTGTQGLKGAIERSKIPPLLCEHIAEICSEKNIWSDKILKI